MSNFCGAVQKVAFLLYIYQLPTLTIPLKVSFLVFEGYVKHLDY